MKFPIKQLKYEFNRSAEQIFRKAKELSVRYATFQNPPVNYELIMLAFIDLNHPIYRLMANRFSLSTPFVKNKLYDYLMQTSEDKPTKLNYQKEEEYLKTVQEEANKSESVVITEEHLLLAIFKNKVRYNYALKLFTKELGIKQELLIDFAESTKYTDMLKEVYHKKRPMSFLRSKPLEQKETSTKKPAVTGCINLEKYGRNINQLAKDGKIADIISRNKEITTIQEILARKKQNNIILIGHPGVGKTAVIEGLALKIIKGDVSERLKNKIIYQIDLGALVSGTTLRGQLEEKINNIIKECKDNKNIIIYFSDIHQITGSNSSGEISTLIKPALLRGEINCIGTTTVSDYQKYIGKDPSIARSFQIIKIDEPNITFTRQILQKAAKNYENFHNVAILEETIDAAIEMSDKYIKDMYLPGKALSLMDRAASRISLSTTTEKNVTRRTIAEIISEKIGIPLTQILFSKEELFLGLEDKLKSRVIGQDHCIKRIADVIQLTKYEMDLNPERPDGVFLIAGPTGTGKTELAKALTESLLGDEKQLLRFDMSEFMEKHNISKLIGSPPGYAGSEEGGLLTNTVKANPYSVILFDEVEKAHPDIFKLFLQIFDDGRLTDAKGMTVLFSFTTIIMTSNLGVKNLDPEELKAIPTDKIQEYIRYKMEPEIKRFFAPEFINRLDDILYFNFLPQEIIHKIAHSKIDTVLKRFRGKGKKISISPEVYNIIIEKGYNPEYGARFLNRSIEDIFLKPLVKYILANPNINNIFATLSKENNVSFTVR